MHTCVYVCFKALSPILTPIKNVAQFKNANLDKMQKEFKESIGSQQPAAEGIQPTRQMQLWIAHTRYELDSPATSNSGVVFNSFMLE